MKKQQLFKSLCTELYKDTISTSKLSFLWDSCKLLLQFVQIAQINESFELSCRASHEWKPTWVNSVSLRWLELLSLSIYMPWWCQNSRQWSLFLFLCGSSFLSLDDILEYFLRAKDLSLNLKMCKLFWPLN